MIKRVDKSLFCSSPTERACCALLKLHRNSSVHSAGDLTAAKHRILCVPVLRAREELIYLRFLLSEGQLGQIGAGCGANNPPTDETSLIREVSPLTGYYEVMSLIFVVHKIPQNPMDDYHNL